MGGRSDPSPGSQKGRICAKLRERTAAIHSYVPELGSRLSMMVAVVPLIVVLSLQKQKTREEKEGTDIIVIIVVIVITGNSGRTASPAPSCP